MKKILTVLFCMTMITTIFAQRGRGSGEVKWLSLSIKGGFGGSLLYNKDVMSDKNVKLNFSPAYSFGGRFGITYGDHVGINIEPTISNFGEVYSISDNTNGVVPYVKTQKLKSFDLFVSLRYISDYGFYVEAGPQFSTMKSASVKNDPSNLLFTDENSVNDYKTNFADKFTSIAAGMGFAAINGDRVQLFIGLRGAYAFGDLNPDYHVLNDGVYHPTTTFTAKTSPITLKLMAELNYFFGFWGDATCGKGRMMFFQ